MPNDKNVTLCSSSFGLGLAGIAVRIADDSEDLLQAASVQKAVTEFYAWCDRSANGGRLVKDFEEWFSKRFSREGNENG